MSKKPSASPAEISKIDQELNALLRFTAEAHLDKALMAEMADKLPKIEQIVREKITARGAGAMHEHADLLWDVLKNCSHRPIFTPILEVFLKAGIDLGLNKNRDALHSACESALELFGKYCPGSLSIDAQKSSGFQRHTPLTFRAGKNAALQETLDEIKQLLLLGANPNARNGAWNAPLHILLDADVADNYMHQAASLLLAAGANPNAPGDQGQTPLGILCSGSHGRSKVKTIAVLLEQGATPCLEVGQLYKIAWMAIDCGNANLLEKALELGLKTQILDGQVKTLHFSAACIEPPVGGMSCLKLLLDHGWDPQLKDESGQTLLERKDITQSTRAIVQSHLASKEARAAIEALSSPVQAARTPGGPMAAK